MAQGRTFAELHALTGGFAWALAVALRDELRRGRLRLDGDRYTLAPDFPPDLLAALRALDRESLRSLAAANGWRPPLAR